MFGIGGGELIFIIFIALMLFGSDKLPDIARTLAKGMAQVKNATNEIKSEIQKEVKANGIDTSIKELNETFTSEVSKMKEGIDTNLSKPVHDLSNEIEDVSGPIKRQM
jgi:sec-independent protein translocase protein TatA